MLGKLCKYEFQSVARTLVPLYIGTLLLALLNGLAMRFDFNFFTGLMILALSAFGIAIFVVTLVLIIQRFWNNLLKDEGYLMFTLPVSSYQLVASKLISALVWSILGALVGLLSILAWFVPLNIEMVAEFFRNFSDYFSQIRIYLAQANINIYFAFFRICLSVLLAMLAEVQMLYFSMSVGQLPVFSRYRVGASFITFILTNFVCQKLSNALMNIVFKDFQYTATNDIGLFLQFLSDSTLSYLNFSDPMNLGLLLLFFFGTGWILKNKLNLE